jgi:prophage regulatory protein
LPLEKLGWRLLRLPAVEEFCGLKKTQIFDLVARGQFPSPVKISDSGRAIAWAEEELMAWRKDRLAKRHLSEVTDDAHR